MKAKLQEMRDAAVAAIGQAATVEEVEALRVRYLGRKGLLREHMAALPALPAEERPRMGELSNRVKDDIAAELARATERLAGGAKVDAVAPVFDITLPGKKRQSGGNHPITLTIAVIRNIFARMGFEVVAGPDVELKYYNFEALNIPLDHPSCDAFDTFYINDDTLLRSHTSPVQVRTMEKRRPPLRVIVPGKCYRPDTVDARHMFMFHQVEGLLVDEGVSFADLKCVLREFARGFFAPDVKTRFRPSFFPFTEPSAEMDVSCVFCEGRGCGVCSQVGWIEVLGCGMVNPRVFGFVDYDPERYTGFAFGMGVERLAMLKHGINDIRLFTENDARFLRQFRVMP